MQFVKDDDITDEEREGCSGCEDMTCETTADCFRKVEKLNAAYALEVKAAHADEVWP